VDERETAVIRRATAADADGLVRLRAVMFEGIRMPPGPANAPWRSCAATWFRDAADSPGFAAFVADHPAEGLVSVATGVVESWTPGPRTPSGVVGRVFNVVTLPPHRRRGHAQECLAALLAWFDGETQAERLELHASGDGIELYRAFGFEVHEHPTMRRARPQG
jgi:GNAT superfamily N-acetyltransferase